MSLLVRKNVFLLWKGEKAVEDVILWLKLYVAVTPSLVSSYLKLCADATVLVPTSDGKARLRLS
jgi:hypothetical protein